MMTGPRFHRMPIRHKLVAMIMITCAAVLLTASAGYLISDYYRTRGELRRELAAMAKLVLDNSQAAIEFRDPLAARETLQSLAANPHLRAACLYDAAGALFAEFRPAQTADCAVRAPLIGFQFGADRLDLTSGGALAGRRFGTVTLRTDLGILTSRLRMQAVVVAGLLVLALVVALILSARLQALVSQPVLALSQTAAQVSARGDYSLRARRTTDDELGELVDAFNRMLERIESREAELSRTNDELRREIAERRRAEQERAEMLVREREANRLKDEFLATLSHELRTPLNAILGWTKLIRAKAVAQASLDRALEKVERNAQVQSRLVEDLLDISRITTGKLRLDQRPFDLIAVANTVFDSIRPAAETRGVVLVRNFSAPTLPTVGDSDRLQQVIWNLLSNAVKFTPAGGTVTVSLAREGNRDRLTVSDTGIGIDPEFLPNVFDTFRQADASSTRSHGGLGLGLSIVKQLVELHGGHVSAASDGPGKGATFVVDLPVRSLPRPDEQRATSATVPEGALSGASVLVVDDDVETREMLAAVLQAAGADVYTANSAEEGFNVAVEMRPDALVTDIAMPGQDGYGLMRQLTTALGSHRPRATIALTAFTAPAEESKAAEAGFSRHLCKPFDPLALVSLLADLLSPRRSLT